MKMRMGIILVGVLVLGGCGVPRGALEMARVEGVVAGELKEGELSGELGRQAEQWGRLDGLVRKRELGGILFVDAEFVALVHRTAAAAKRLKELVEKGEDDAGLRREEVEAFRVLWGEVQRYLGG